MFVENDEALLSVKPAVRQSSIDSHRSETSRGASPTTVQGATKPGLRSNRESYSEMLSVLPASVASNMSVDSSKYTFLAFWIIHKTVFVSMGVRA